MSKSIFDTVDGLEIGNIGVYEGQQFIVARGDNRCTGCLFYCDALYGRRNGYRCKLYLSILRRNKLRYITAKTYVPCKHSDKCKYLPVDKVLEEL